MILSNKHRGNIKMNKDLVIEEIKTDILDIPLIRPHKMSFGTVKEVNIVLVRIINKDGLIGIGEASTLGGPTWSEESAETIKVIIDRYLASIIERKNLLDYPSILREMDFRVKGNHFAKAAIEMAFFDILGKYFKQPVHFFLGGKYRDKIPLSWSIASENVEEEIKEAVLKREEGFKIFKVKVGALSLKEDINRIKTLREKLGTSIGLRVDVNQGWDLITAMRAVEELKPYNLDFIEQPLPKWNSEGLSEIRKRSSIPIMADESLTDEFEALKIINNRAADIFSYKLTKMGGFTSAKKIYSITEAAGLSSYIGCMIETGVGTAAYLHFAASLPELVYGCELWGPLLLKYDICSNPIKYENGYVYVPQGNGLGIEVKQEKIDKYRRK